MKNKKQGIARFKELFWYSDSEPNEVLIGIIHMFALPASILVEYDDPAPFLCLVAIGAGAFQLYSVLWNGTLQMRFLAVRIAALVAVATIFNLSTHNLMNGSRVGWLVIGVFAVWNSLRVFKEKLDRHG
jgi:hypothetical protein